MLCGRSEPIPRFRMQHLVRAGVVCSVLILGTVVVDWIGVAALADRALWNGTTRWLIGALVPVSALAAAGLLLGSRAARTLPQPWSLVSPSGNSGPTVLSPSMVCAVEFQAAQADRRPARSALAIRPPPSAGQ